MLSCVKFLGAVAVPALALRQEKTMEFEMESRAFDLSACTPIRSGAESKGGRNCSYYIAIGCSYYDDITEINDDDFTLADMCCISELCTSAPTSAPTTTRADNNGDTPTPGTTVRPRPPSALGDPHVTNANQDHFDINHPGNFTLARIPREGPALLEINGTIESRNHICNHFFTSARVGGQWMGDTVVSVRAFTNFHWLAEDMRWPFGIQTAGGGEWRALTEFPAGSDVELASFERQGVQVELKASHAAPRPGLDTKRVRNTERPSDGFFQLTLRNPASGSRKAATLKFTTKLFWINIELMDLLALGYKDIAGVLGTDTPEADYAEPSDKCLEYLRRGTDKTASLLQAQHSSVELGDERPFARATL